jgi:hypothetical protein
MKPVVPVVCLLFTVTTAWAGLPADDEGTSPATSTPHDASVPRVRAVRFTGDPAFQPHTLEKVLQSLEVRHVIPGIWTRMPRYEARAVAADLARLHSFYFSHGYFDARVEVGAVTVDGRDATLSLDVQSGPKYAVRHIEIDGVHREREEIGTDSSGELPVDTLCARLLDARQVAELHGHIDFTVELEVSHTDGPLVADTGRGWVDVAVRVQTGPAYTVRRINFSGHHRINESTLRGAMQLRERSLFDVGKLRASLAALNRSGLFEPLTLRDVEIVRNPDNLSADLTVAVREPPRRRWSLNGPVGPSAFGLLEARVSSRLPPWGRGLFEASTYYLTFSLTGFSNPMIRLLPIRVRPSPPAVLVLERPYLPGQPLFSGFALSPQLSSRRLLAGYGLTHLERAAQVALTGAPPDSSSVLLLVSGSGPGAGSGGAGEARFLICSPPVPNRWLREATRAANIALGSSRPW